MKPAVPLPEEFPQNIRASLLLVFGAVLVGGATGFIGVAFLRALDFGNQLRTSTVGSLENWPPGLGVALFAISAGACAAFATWLVLRFSPHAAGSGIPYVEKILRGPGEPDHRFVLPVKFLGGFVALSSGLVLGREGPLVQMGAVIGDRIGRFFKGVENAWKPLMAAGAGAGVATAFNAPVGGTIFILEEVLKKATPLSFALTAAAAVSSACVQRGIFGMGPDYTVPFALPGPVENIWLYALLGIALGILGAAYNRLLLGLAAPSSPLKKISALPRAFAIGAVVGTAGWFLPDDFTGGDSLTQQILSSPATAGLLLAVALARFFTGPLSYAAGTPGGLFAPIVALGALLGSAGGSALHALQPDLAPSPAAFAVAGMAAFFTATIRAPLTGIVICLEMTGCYQLFLPMLAACLGSHVSSAMLRAEPIYDALAAQAVPKV